MFLRHGMNQTFVAISPLLSQGDGVRNGLIQQTFNKPLLRLMYPCGAVSGMGLPGLGWLSLGGVR